MLPLLPLVLEHVKVIFQVEQDLYYYADFKFAP